MRRASNITRVADRAVHSHCAKEKSSIVDSFIRRNTSNGESPHHPWDPVQPNGEPSSLCVRMVRLRALQLITARQRPHRRVLRLLQQAG